MSAAEFLEQKFAQLLRWEKRKHCEQLLIRAVLYSLLAALLLLPLYGLLPSRLYRWFVPLPVLALLGPFILYNARWRRHDSAQALARLDKVLGLEERALTAWELVERKASRAAALLVLSQAAERLKTFEPKAQFPRRRSRHAYIALALLPVWLGVVWFDFNPRSERDVAAPTMPGLAYQLRDYSRQLQEKAGGEGLRESLQVARELEKAAQKGIEAQTADEQFRNELTGLSAKVEAMGKEAAREPTFATAESRQNLRDLKAELEAAQSMLDLPDGIKGASPGQSLLDRLTTLPQLKRRLDQQGETSQGLGQGEMKTFLDTLDKQVTGELDRRTLLDAQKYLEQMARRETDGATDNQMAMRGGGGDEDAAGDGEKVQSSSNLPGSEPGTKEEAPADTGAQPGVGAATQLKGTLGEGESRGLVLKGKPSAGSPTVAQQDVIATYRRQAEQDLNTERVPEALKETVRKYFLSLEAGETQLK